MKKEAQDYLLSRITSIRLAIASAIYTLRNPHAVNSSREISTAITDLQRAFHNLGKAKYYLGSETPYKESENPESTVIEETDDFKYEVVAAVMSAETQTAAVKAMRSYLSGISKELEITINDSDPSITMAFLNHLTQAANFLFEAKSWLGWELRNCKLQWDYREIPVGDSEAPTPKPINVEKPMQKITGEPLPLPKDPQESETAPVSQKKISDADQPISPESTDDSASSGESESPGVSF